MRAQGRQKHSWRRAAFRIALVALLAPAAVIAVYRFLPPPVTPLMLIRRAEGEPLVKRWVPLSDISPNLIRAVVASEDERVCVHHGFDWTAIAQSWNEWRHGGALRGASTISMQTARNLLLWPGGSFLRKGAEAYLTVLIEFLWSKHRIMEVYLNIIEWGPGIYGAEASARAHFGTAASRLSVPQAALLAAVLPNPRRWSPDRPTPYIDARAAFIRQHMPMVAIPRAGGCH